METLAERIARDGPVSELDAIGWAIRLAKRLEALHTLGVAHGSVSPACVIAAGQDRNARAYLADVQHTTTSPAYHSPERILGGDISAADDVWALSATLYALLTGQSPFSGHNDAEIRQKILAAAPPPLAVFDVGDDDLQHILDRAFAREIGQRTAGISAFRHALEEWHPDRGVANLPPLEDDDSTNDDDDGARTMMVSNLAGLDQLREGSRPNLPKVNDDESEDEDNVRTQMRQLPKDALAAIVARASAGRAAAPAPAAAHDGGGPHTPGLAGVPRPAPFPAAQAHPHAAGPAAFPRPGPPRPAAGGAHPAAAAVVPQPAAPAPEPVRIPVPAVAAPPQGFGSMAIPQLDDDDADDENIRTVMMTSEQMMHEEESHDAPRTILLADADPWKQAQPSPAAGQPAAPAWQDGPAPAPTVALPVNYELAAPSFNAHGAAGAPDGFLHGAAGTQKIPPIDALRASPAFAHAPQAQPPVPAFPPPAQQPLGLAPVAAPQQVLGAAPAAQAMVPAAQRAPDGKKGLILAALFALLIAAGATFAFLKLKGL